jgi:hypothetical protein
MQHERVSKIKNGNRQTMHRARMTIFLCNVIVMSGCTPTVNVAVPNEPITINLNVRIEHEIRVQVEEELENIFSPASGLF